MPDSFVADLPASKPLYTTVPFAIISNGLAPYRVALHRRVVREIPEVQLFSVFTHQVSNAAWPFDPPAEIGPMLFGEGEQATQQASPVRALHEWLKGGRIIRWMEQKHVGAVLLEGYNDLGRLRILRWCRRNAVPCFLWGDSNIKGDRYRGIRAWGKKLIVSRILKSCTAALACGSQGRRFFSRYGVGDDRIFFYPLEPDYSLIEQLPATAISAAREQFNLPTDRRRLVYSGRFSPEKRPDLAVDGFLAVASARPNWDLVMMGDGPMRQQLLDSVPRTLEHRIIWTGFISDQPTVSSVYRNCDVLVLPSDRDAWALSVNEAAAAGLAIITSDVVGSAAELVRDGINGCQFPRGDVRELAMALLRVTDPAAIDKLKHGSSEVLAEWRRRGDPIAGLRKALRAAHVLPSDVGAGR